jgi:type III pantothenate kinase
MRFKALHVFTAVLPQVAFTEPEVFIGNTTETSILTGVFWGIVSEINGMMDFYSQKHGSVQVLLCGGDSSFFAKHIKNSIFAAPNLVLTGLNKLAEINVT